MKKTLPLLIGVATALTSGHVLAYRTIAALPDYSDTERVRWQDGFYQFEVSSGVPDWLPVGSLVTIAERALFAWTEPSCSALVVGSSGVTPDPAVSGDGRNTIEVITEGWEALGYEPEALGATALELEATDDGWRIVEADIRLNAEHHAWSLSDVPSDGSRSLLGTLRHEGGHALGLLHPCEEDGADGAPLCDASFERATLMYPFYEVEQIELTPDDTAGICSLYPACELDGCETGFVCSAGACLLECGDGVCERDELCIDGACISQEECERTGCFVTPPAWVIGCEPSGDCPDGLCLSDGSCARQCAGDGDCDENRPCTFDEDPNIPGYCGLVPLKKLGEACSLPSECEDGECLAGAEARSVCTRTCSAAEPPCPNGWSCSGVESRLVCVPPRTPRGCAVSTQVPGEPSELPLSGVLLASLTLVFSTLCRRRGRVAHDRIRSTRF